MPHFRAFLEYNCLLNGLQSLIDIRDGAVAEDSGKIYTIVVPKGGIWGTAGIDGLNIDLYVIMCLPACLLACLFSVFWPVCLLDCLSVGLSVCWPVCWPVRLPVRWPVRWPVCWPVCWPVSLLACLFVCQQ